MSLRAKIRFLVSGGIGFAFFLLPVPFDGRLTVPFDLAIRWVTGRFSGPVAVYCLAAVVLGSIATVLATRKRVPESPTWWSGFRSSPAITAVRLAGLPLALLYFFG